MYLVLLVFGALLTVAGVILAASGIAVHDHAFDATTATPGIVAVIGGLVLFGLGLALRVLQRIERALAARPMPRATRSDEAVVPAAASALPSEPMRVSIAAKATSHPQAVAVSPFAPSTSADEKPFDDFAGKIPAAARIETSRAVAELGAAPLLKSFVPKSLSQAMSLRGNEDVGEVNGLRAAARRVNGAATTRTTPRLDIGARAPVGSERSNGPAFDSLWPKGPRSLRAVQQPPVQAPVAPATEPEQNVEPAPETAPSVTAQDEAPAPVTVLKSGMVDGMAYTLFSDGSIEAALPQGRLRFGSITELRHHIEQSA